MRVKWKVLSRKVLIWLAVEVEQAETSSAFPLTKTALLRFVSRLNDRWWKSELVPIYLHLRTWN